MTLKYSIVTTLMSLHCLPNGTLNTTEEFSDSQLRNIRPTSLVKHRK